VGAAEKLEFYAMSKGRLRAALATIVLLVVVAAIVDLIYLWATS
jgi:hypothetical protein